MDKAKNENTQNTHTKGKTILRGLVFFVCLAVVICLVICVLKWTGVWNKVNSVAKLRQIVEKGGAFSAIVFMLLQFLQTTVLQIPAILVTMSGVLIFSKLKAFLLSFIAIMLGSFFNFWLGRKAGRKFLPWLAGEQATEKWINIISEGKYVFFLMMLFPMFPDDILCVVAGLTNMSFAFFFWSNVICRSIGIGCIVLFGSGSIIPFSGWGWAVWILIAICLASLFYLSVKYQHKIDEWLQKLTKKFKNKSKKHKNSEK